jgi:hypothetical protein
LQLSDGAALSDELSNHRREIRRHFHHDVPIGVETLFVLRDGLFVSLVLVVL